MTAMRMLHRSPHVWMLGVSLWLMPNLQGVAQQALSIRIEPPAKLLANTAASIAVLVRVPEGSSQPLLLTPSTEGDSLRAVRGRLLRADARSTGHGELLFAVPVATKSAGTAVLRIEVLTYHCQQRCLPLRATARRVLQVQTP